jgi:hypothetical protein
MERRIYVLHTDKQAAGAGNMTSFRKDEILKLQSKYGGTIRFMSKSLWDQGGSFGWDWPTFQAQSQELKVNIKKVVTMVLDLEIEDSDPQVIEKAIKYIRSSMREAQVDLGDFTSGGGYRIRRVRDIIVLNK